MNNWNTQKERRGSRVEEISEVLMSENFSKLKTENKPHIQEGQKIPNQTNNRKIIKQKTYTQAYHIQIAEN